MILSFAGPAKDGRANRGRLRLTPSNAPRIEIRTQGRIGAYSVAAKKDCATILLSACRLLGLNASHEISVLLCDGPTMHRLNRQWRRVDRPTNVLSFPLHEMEAGAVPPREPLGDIVMALPVVRREARDLDLEFQRHLSHLLVHGLLHLLGHDHAKPGEARKMEAQEGRILAKLWPK